MNLITSVTVIESIFLYRASWEKSVEAAKTRNAEA